MNLCRRLTVSLTFAFALLTFSLNAFAANGLQYLSLDEFQHLSVELSGKVNLFRDVWKADPDAQIAGGTVRDYLFWIKEQFKGVKTRTEAEKQISRLRELPVIDSTLFLLPDSDADIVTTKNLSLKADSYKIKRIDAISNERFSPSTPQGRSEIEQGYLPSEKILLSRTDIKTPDQFGNGVGEIHRGRFSVSIPPLDQFSGTEYAAKNLNHRILLAGRYLRVIALNQFRSEGRNISDPNRLVSEVPPRLLKQIQEIVEGTAKDPAFDEAMKNSRFVGFLNGNIQKAFSGYTSPEAALALFKAFGFEGVWNRNPGLEPVNQYLFGKEAVPLEQLKLRFAAYGTTPENVFEPTNRHISDGKVYHGTSTDKKYRAILSQGVIPSTTENVYAGAGLYAVGKDDIDWIKNNYAKGSVGRIASFTVSPESRLIDISQGPGKALFEAFKARSMFSHESAKISLTHSIDAFAEEFGADVIRYKIRDGKERAYVVKNAAILSAPEGYKRKLLTVSQLSTMASEVKDRNTLREFNDAFTEAGIAGQDSIDIVGKITGPPILTKRLSALASSQLLLSSSGLDPNLHHQLITLTSELDELVLQGENPKRQAHLARRIVRVFNHLELSKMMQKAYDGAPHLYRRAFEGAAEDLWQNAIDSSTQRGTISLITREFSRSLSKIDGLKRGGGIMAQTLLHEIKNPSIPKSLPKMAAVGAACFALVNLGGYDNSDGLYGARNATCAGLTAFLTGLRAYAHAWDAFSPVNKDGAVIRRQAGLSSLKLAFKRCVRAGYFSKTGIQGN